jgi:hypothetical protein
MDLITEEFTLTLKYKVTVDPETGEMKTTCISRKVDKSNFEVSEDKPSKKTSKVKKEESSEPTLVLEENKCIFNKAALDLMEIQPGCKLDIKYEKQGKNTIPVIGDDEVWGTHNGNKLNKNMSLACRGSKHDELSKFGVEFKIIAHNTKPGLFILVDKNSAVETEDVELEDLPSVEEELDLPIDVDLQDLIDDKDADITEVTASMFQL